MIEFTVEHKEDVWRIPAETNVLRINCSITMHDAHRIVMRCRELSKIIFSGAAFANTPRDAIDYLNSEVYHVSVEGEIQKAAVPKGIEKEIKKLYARGDHNIDTLAQQFDLPKEIIWHIIHRKALEK